MSILGMLLLGGAAAAVAGAFDNDKKEPESKVLGQRFALPTESEERARLEAESKIDWQQLRDKKRQFCKEVHRQGGSDPDHLVRYYYKKDDPLRKYWNDDRLKV